MGKSKNMMKNNSINNIFQEEFLEKDVVINNVCSMLGEIVTFTRFIKPVIKNAFIDKSIDETNVVHGIKFGNSEKDRVIKGIALGLSEIVTRKELSRSLGNYYSERFWANMDSLNSKGKCVSKGKNSLVKVKFKNSNKIAYTKESVILYLYAELEVGNEKDQAAPLNSAISRKAS